MVGRAAKVTAEVTKGLVAAGAVGPSGRAAAATVRTAEVPRARGCGTGGTIKVARLAEDGGCRAAEATEVATWVGARGCCVGGACGCVESPERKEAWMRSAFARAAAVEWFRASILEATRVSHSRWVRVDSPRAAADSWSPWRAVAEWRSKVASCAPRGAATRSCSAVARSSAVWSEAVLAGGSSDTCAWARPISTSWRDTRSMAASCTGLRLSQMNARYPRWGGGLSLEAWKVRGNGAVGRNPGVRSVPEPVLARRSVRGIGERSKSGPGAEEDVEAVLVVILGDGVAEVLEEDMLRGAHNGARGEKLRGGHTRSEKGGWLATSVVTRGAVAETR